MGFASKFSTGSSKAGTHDDTVLASPDTQFGAGLMPEPAQVRSADDAALRLGDLGNVVRRRQRAAAAAASLDADLRLPLIGHMSLPRQLRIVLVGAVIGIGLTILALWQNSASRTLAASQTQIASDALMHSQRIGKAAPNALHGRLDAFGQLQESQARLTRDLAVLSLGGDYNGRSIPAPSAELAAQLSKAHAKWTATEGAAGTILKAKPQLVAFAESLKEVEAAAFTLQATLEQVLAQKAQQGGSARELAALGRLALLAERLTALARQFHSADGAGAETANRMGRDSEAFAATLAGLLDGSAALGLAPLREPALRAQLEQVRAGFEPYHNLVTAYLDKLDKFNSAQSAGQLIVRDNESLKKLLADVQSAYHNQQESTDGWFWLLIVASICTLAMGGSISRVMLQDSRNRTRGADARRQEADALRLLAQAKEEEAKATNDQNQAAILRLMNELQEVADGDLTVHATVSEDITGAIADSVNYTVEELRALVVRVIDTAAQVNQASNHAQNIASELFAATDQQSREIKETSSTVLRMAGEITDVSRSAIESAEVARQSVAAAQQGATAVQNAILGMHEIREQIQETSKRIKRLGESSQEIGEITELISDITEQTNVLALNAAIQAAAAGEAGRGFSVVAEEVQRLAERSGEAAKQIGTLVRAIQTDTHDAVAAMEQSTQGVVEGARLSDAAGAALADISRVSNRLAELIQGMAFATELQATSASGVANNIQHILSVTEHTQHGTQQTAHSIRQLALLAQELKDSVSRFRVAA
ncbi:methyl-accepting chemotaxis protein [Massilia horti]|uniref:Methyl-accepting chemotaxis protein n=1 Tax=Massilia horti TaxID=2562153 RepID=A0A4Y9T2U1_9BURK|nr:methyl-accepting chemotaxis protein [Massilia horti]TFW34001.1 methyl-accepting chemotaxis protein [Massilia horti]